jgi:hypothetical protein
MAHAIARDLEAVRSLGGVFIPALMATLVRTSHAALFVMRPHADDLDDLFVFQNLYTNRCWMLILRE